MDSQHENRFAHGLTLQELLRALNEELLAQTSSGQLASDLNTVRLRSISFIPVQS